MLWLKALHIIFVISWFAGVFYLPRLFVNHAMSDDAKVRAQLLLMEQKLFRFMSILAVLAVGFGAALLLADPAYYLSQRWMQIKLLAIAALIAYHIRCGFYIEAFREGRVNKSHRYFRFFNEAPVLLMFAIVILAVVRPFS